MADEVGEGEWFATLAVKGGRMLLVLRGTASIPLRPAPEPR